MQHGWQKVRPDIDSLVVKMEQRNKASRNALEFMTVAVLDEWIDLHSLGEFFESKHCRYRGSLSPNLLNCCFAVHAVLFSVEGSGPHRHVMISE